MGFGRHLSCEVLKRNNEGRSDDGRLNTKERTVLELFILSAQLQLNLMIKDLLAVKLIGAGLPDPYSAKFFYLSTQNYFLHKGTRQHQSRRNGRRLHCLR